MAERKQTESARTETSGATRKTAQQEQGEASSGSGRATRWTSEGGAAPGESAQSASGLKTNYQRRYLVGVRPMPGFPASPADTLHETLKRMDDIEIIGRVRPKGLKGLSAGIPQGAQEVVVVRMDEQRATVLRQSAPAHVVVEEDAPLGVGQARFSLPFGPSWSTPTAPTPRRHHAIRFRVVGADDQPLGNAGITVFCRGFGAQAITDSSGAASVTMFEAVTDPSDIQAVYVQPASDHWECFVTRPLLHYDEANVIRLSPLLPAAKSFGAKRVGWAHEAMGVDGLAAGLTGAAVRIALIDSGCDNDHPMLRHITRGIDMTAVNGARDWTHDEIGQGTHCAGIIAGNGAGEAGVAGIAPDAEIHVFKLCPGGHFSDLIEALDQCIERQIDIVHIGVSSDQGSELVAQKIIEARARGVACIAGTGDEGGPTQFLAMVPGVMSVAAIGRLGTSPPDSHHALTAIPESTGPAGFFAANFCGLGPRVGICAPGVAVISSVPNGGLAARDGTATAAAEIVGFAALILAHHPLFRGVYGSRGERRVDALFELIRGSAMPPVFDLARVGAGMPNMRRVPGMGTEDSDAWSRIAQNFGTFAGARAFSEPTQAGFAQPANLTGTMALMQLRAAGLI